jgi:hypothetical protein
MARDPVEKKIHDGRRIAAFLEDSEVKEAFERVAQRAYKEFQLARTDEARREAWAKAHVLDSITVELRAVVQAGTSAAAKLEKQR